MTTLVSTAFTGSDGAGWPAPWTVTGGTGQITSNRGQLTSPAGAWSGGEAVAGLTTPTGRVEVTVRFPAVPGRSARINVRWNAGSGNGYRLIMPTDYNGFQLLKVTAYAETALIEEFTTVWAANTDYRVVVEFDGTALRAKRWPVGDTEPGVWDLVTTDATYTTGDVALVCVNNGSGGAQSVLFDDVLITDTPLGGAVVPSGDGSRVGFHNDAFQADFEDFGTWTTFTDLSAGDTRAYAIAQTAAGLPFGGESAAANPPDTLGPALLAELGALHTSYLNPEYHPDVWAGLTGPEQDEVARRLGYRLRLTSALLPAAATAGTPVPVVFTLVNDGWSRVYRERPTRVVFVNGGTVVTRTLVFDVRSVTPGATVTASGAVTAPNAGAWAMHLLFPDADEGLAATPAYSVQLANTGVWDPVTGRNSLGHTLTVT